MYQAELQGKVSPTTRRSEDVLTSNVFSFLKYSAPCYLDAFLFLCGISCTKTELADAEFIFWPNYDDRTQPDVVILVGDYYLLVEAKYHSGVGEEEGNKAGQLVREFEAGRMEAQNQNRQFKLIFLTADYLRPKETLMSIPVKYRDDCTWINWQAIAGLLLGALESADKPPSISFARDLYELLDKKNLRAFLSFSKIKTPFVQSSAGRLFFAAETARFRGAFLGYDPVFLEHPTISSVPSPVFFSRTYMSGFPIVEEVSEEVFYRRKSE